MLKQKVALVTGASRGIGAAIADTLAANGAQVIGTATTQAGAEAISQRLAARGGVGHQLDVCEPEAIERLIEQSGEIAILVNNAGMTRDGLMLRMSENDWDSLIDTNLKSVFRASKAVLPRMIKARFGRIITITSVVGVMGNAGQANYAAAKAGIIGLTKSLAREVGSRHITVNCVAPGFIDTDMTRALSEEQRAALLKQIPLTCFGESQDIADAVLFLASDKARYMTGQTLHVNGGLLMP